ncbi:SH3 domain-containing protein [Cryptosporangium sp. NPDC051539]|uniref:SH3 domain-containing protein n=1 Tax=Cryptosporangium sp. NPDC051539 TaxID=3363962 RepID=UPI0037A8379A
MRVRVQNRHQVPDRRPITIRPGERVEVGDRDDEWPAFVFVTNVEGQGWVPERHLDLARPTATVRTPYDTRELGVSAGATVTVIRDDPESEWAWCRDDAGNEGWVPHRVLGAGVE